MNNCRQITISEPGDVWFFTYGSLMWNPGFKPLESSTALLHGWHRRFCVASTNYRGTLDKPGLTLGLDRGGSCRGRALRIAKHDREGVLEYLAKREMPEGIYNARKVKLTTNVTELVAYTLVVNRQHPFYVQRMPLAEMAVCIANCSGQKGSNRDYLVQTVNQINALGITDGLLHRLLDRVEKIASGGN